MEKPTTTTATNRKLTRQRSRLQMHAPSSIGVAPATAAAAAASVADWNVAIPLLSPLDIGSLPGSCDRTVENECVVKERREPSDGGEEEERRAMKWATWQHQVSSPFFCYEPKGPRLLWPDCA